MTSESTAAARQTILNVDDSEAGRYATSRILTRAGFEVLEAANGTDALALAAQHPALILLDVDLPDLSGFEVCRRIKADPLLASIPVLHLSAIYVQRNQRVQGLEGGADGYLVQPVEAAELVATIRAFLRLKSVEAALLQSNDRYRDLVENSHDLISIHDLAGKLLLLNPAAVRITGYTLAALMGMNMADLLGPESIDRFPAYLAHIKAQGAAHGLIQIRTATGAFRWLEFNNSLRSEGVAAPVVRGLAQDVTERKAAQAEVRRQMDELHRWQDVMLGREDRIMELKREVNALLRRLSEPIRYPSQEDSASTAP